MARDDLVCRSFPAHAEFFQALFNLSDQFVDTLIPPSLNERKSVDIGEIASKPDLDASGVGIASGPERAGVWFGRGDGAEFHQAGKDGGFRGRCREAARCPPEER